VNECREFPHLPVFEMYFPNGCPETLRLVKGSESKIISVVCNRDKVLLAVLYEQAVEIWYYRVSMRVFGFRFLSHRIV
jgi:hypothetical protein